AAGLETAVLNRQAFHERLPIDDDAVLKIQDGILSDIASAALHEAAIKLRVTAFVRALTGELHPQLPLGFGKIGEAARGRFDTVGLFVHLTLEKLDLMMRVLRRQVGALDPAIFDLKSGVARRIFGEQFRSKRWGHAISLSSRNRSAISCWVKPALMRSSVLT